MKQKKVEFNNKLSVLENLSLHRDERNKKSRRRYVVQRIIRFLRIAALLSLGLWCYLTRDNIKEYILDVFTNPKLMYPPRQLK